MSYNPMICFHFLITALFLNVLEAQSTNAKYFKQLGIQLITDRQYEEAYSALISYQKAFPKDKKILLELAICSYHIQSVDKMELYLNNYAQFIDRKAAIYDFYEARLQRLREDYQKATHHYKKFLQQETEHITNRNLAKQELRQCGIAIQLQHRAPAFKMVNNHKTINTAFDEIRPIASPNYDETFYFSSNRRNNSDIYVVEENTYPKLLEQATNTGADEYLLSFGCNGQSIYFQRDHLFLVDTFSKTAPHEMNLPQDIQTNSIFLLCDTILLFASEILEGYGGYDLFFSRKLLDGWTSPENLGAAINSTYDEKSPFLDRDGRSLYFSSNDPTRSIGRYDIFKSIFKLKSKTWSAPQNLGTSINSAADELDFTLNSTGTKAYFISNHWRGQGGNDIYQLDWDGQVERAEEVFFFGDFIAFEQEELANQIESIPLNKLYYRIQLKTSIEDTLRLPTYLADSHIIYDDKRDLYTYYFGIYQSFEAALAWCKEVQKKGWKKAKVVAYLEANKIAPEEIQYLIESYEDLKYYSKYLESEPKN